ncbi:hypothetical protein CKM354_000745400 [Cercospora kikuchii]|uniref:F-box domain-containing protein n=1 Tax=Cercospora kikuchii TaxID=84275 RepID=A0A9P3FJ46_9PEZI|nr:uncharacterized protein CKM354_000745400 [Cercospora kikuchii]GIZ44250.1 hypothetical protein CKM354_000745400 [Cercospora kikuchii]
MALNRLLGLKTPSAPHYDKYWGLNTYQNTQRTTLLQDLERKGFTFRADVRKAELVEVQQRLDRGLLHYEDKRITNAQLSSFIQNRQLSKPVASTRKAMISVLLGADEALHFDKFVDLPPELRERIYQFHISSLPERLFCPTQPPITRTCKLFRKEALPIFHRLTTFEFRFYFVNDQYHRGDDISKAVLRPCFQTTQFLNTMRTRDAAPVRLDSILTYVMEGSMRDMLLSSGDVMAWCSLEMDRTLQMVDFDGRSMRRGKDLLAIMKHKYDDLDSSRSREDTFSLDDLYSLREALEVSVFSAYRKFEPR